MNIHQLVGERPFFIDISTGRLEPTMADEALLIFQPVDFYPRDGHHLNQEGDIYMMNRPVNLDDLYKISMLRGQPVDFSLTGRPSRLAW